MKCANCSNAVQFANHDERWSTVLGSSLKCFELYGYRKAVTNSVDAGTGKTTKETCHFEPHLLILHFNNNTLLGVANFSFEEDFMPKDALGDDLWIILNRDRVYSCIDQMSLEILTSEELPATSASGNAG